MEECKKINWVIEKEEISVDFIDFYLKSSDKRKAKYRYTISKDEGECKAIGSKCYSLDEFEQGIKRVVVPRIFNYLEQRSMKNGKR